MFQEREWITRHRLQGPDVHIEATHQPSVYVLPYDCLIFVCLNCFLFRFQRSYINHKPNKCTNFSSQHILAEESNVWNDWYHWYLMSYSYINSPVSSFGRLSSIFYLVALFKFLQLNQRLGSGCDIILPPLFSLWRWTFPAHGQILCFH